MMQRRAFLQRAFAAGVLGPAVSLNGPAESAAATETRRPITVSSNTLPRDLHESIDREVQAYMHHQNAPGMGLALTDLQGHEYVAAYGYERLCTKEALSAEKLFQIGSISKSMAAVLILQLVEERKIDLHRPVLEYLPWLAWKTPHGPVTLHHVMTHTSGMPNSGALVFPDSSWTHEQRYAPGERYFYSNMAFNVLGAIVESIDKRSYQQSLATRLFVPLGMTHTLPVIGGPGWKKQANSYIPAAMDKPYLRFDPLREAPAFHEETSAGCVVSTPGDMARYLRFVLRGGVADDGTRHLSAAQFEKMTTPWVRAEEFGETASYGYGIAVDHHGGSKVLLHTGGMISFMSSFYLDLTGGVAAFASINAQQGYRPKPVTRYAVEALTAKHKGAGAPPPIIVESQLAHDAASYVGEYLSGQGAVSITSTIHGLNLIAGTKSLVLYALGENFAVQDEVLGADHWVFVRNNTHQVIGLGHGNTYYRKQGIPEILHTELPTAMQAYIGAYINDDPWIGALKVVERRGQLYLDDSLMTPREDGSFHVESEANSSDRASFRCIIDGEARVLILNGTQLRRFHVFA